MLQRFGNICRLGQMVSKNASLIRSSSRSISDVKTSEDDIDSDEPKPFQLRDYQEEAVDTCIEHITKDKAKRIGVSLATGGGKTVIFASLIHTLNKLHDEKLKQKKIQTKQTFKTLILVHRRELALQALEKIDNVFYKGAADIEMGKWHADPESSNIIVASVQSLRTRLDKYKPDNFDLIIVDEAHHIIAKSYMQILKHFNADVPETKVPVIGFSATFERADKRALSQALDEIVYDKDVMEMIEEKWLCEGRFTNVKISAKLDDVKRTRSDFILPSLSSVINTPETNNIIVKTYMFMKKKHGIKSTLVFGVDKAHVNALNDAFIAKGINSECITSDFKTVDRDRILQSFKDGKTEVLINCGILTEGTDIPNIDCILLCRPTCSRPLFVQMIGRGLRQHKDKEHCHIVDFVNASSVGVMSVPTLFGIHEFDPNMKDMTFSELEAWKKKEAEKAKEAKRVAEEEKLKQALDEAKLAAEKYHEKQRQERLRKETFAQAYKDYLKTAKITLLSYDSFRDYYLGKNKALFPQAFKKRPQSLTFDFELEAKQFSQSKYQWTQVSADSWVLSLQKRYFKIDRTIDQQKYVLKLYNEVNFESDYQGRWITHGKPLVADLATILNEVNEIVNTLEKENSRRDPRFRRRIPNIDYSKNAKWRKEPMSAKQVSYLTKKINDVYTKHQDKFPNVDSDTIDSFLETLPRGPAADLTFASTIAPVYPVKSLLKLLDLEPTLKAGPPP